MNHRTWSQHPQAKRLLLALLLATSAAPALTAPVTESITRDIRTAQSELNRVQTRIGNERAAVAASLNDLEAQAAQLRGRAAAAQRVADEATLSLQQLQSRLDEWRQQQAYQNNQLHRFLREFDAVDADGRDAIERATAVAEQARARLSPAWQEAPVVRSDGHIQQLPTLILGPNIWYWDAAATQGGQAVPSDAPQGDGLLEASYLLKGNEANQLRQLYQTGTGELAIDPSQRATRLASASEGPLEHISKGGLWAIPILGFALFALAIALLKAWQLWRLPKILTLSPGQLRAVVTGEQKVPALAGYQGQLADIARESPQPRVRDDRLFAALANARHHLEQWLGAIAVTAAVAPLLGLLGTVSGMIETFKMMTLFGAGDPQVVSGGISQALITTELGLVVAIPALILNAVLSRRAKHYYGGLENCALHLSEDPPEAGALRPAPTNSSPRKEAVAL